MGKKKGGKGQKKIQGAKAKSILKAKREAKSKMKASSKGKKTQSKAVRTNLKKMTFNTSKKIELLNADITKVLMPPAKASPSTSKVKKPVPSGDADMPDVSGLSNMMATI